jgi:hypothetical protein
MRRKVNFLFRTFLRTINSCRVWKKQPITCVQKIIIYHRASNTKFQKSKRTFFTSTLTMKNCREFNISLQKQNRSRNGFFYCDALSVEQINNIAISTFQTKGALFVNGRIFKCPNDAVVRNSCAALKWLETRKRLLVHFFCILHKQKKFRDFFVSFAKKFRRNQTWKKQKSVLPDFSWYNIPKHGKYTKWPYIMPNCHKIYQRAVKYYKCIH